MYHRTNHNHQDFNLINRRLGKIKTLVSIDDGKTALKKRESCNLMPTDSRNGPGGHYARQNSSVIRQILFDPTSGRDVKLSIAYTKGME